MAALAHYVGKQPVPSTDVFVSPDGFAGFRFPDGYEWISDEPALTHPIFQVLERRASSVFERPAGAAPTLKKPAAAKMHLKTPATAKCSAWKLEHSRVHNKARSEYRRICRDKHIPIDPVKELELARWDIGVLTLVCE